MSVEQIVLNTLSRGTLKMFDESNTVKIKCKSCQTILVWDKELYEEIKHFSWVDVCASCKLEELERLIH